MSGWNLIILGGCWLVAMGLIYIRLYMRNQIRSWIHASLVLIYLPGLMVFSASDFISFAPFKFIGQFILFLCIFVSASFAFQPPTEKE